MTERRFRCRQIQEMADKLGPFLAICREAELFRADPAEVVRENSAALGLLLPVVREVIQGWLRELDELKLDLSYRERALRAERQLREIRRKKHE